MRPLIASRVSNVVWDNVPTGKELMGKKLNNKGGWSIIHACIRSGSLVYLSRIRIHSRLDSYTRVYLHTHTHARTHSPSFTDLLTRSLTHSRTSVFLNMFPPQPDHNEIPLMTAPHSLSHGINTLVLHLHFATLFCLNISTGLGCGFLYNSSSRICFIGCHLNARLFPRLN